MIPESEQLPGTYQQNPFSDPSSFWFHRTLCNTPTKSNICFHTSAQLLSDFTVTHTLAGAAPVWSVSPAQSPAQSSVLTIQLLPCSCDHPALVPENRPHFHQHITPPGDVPLCALPPSTSSKHFHSQVPGSIPTHLFICSSTFY